MFGKKKKLIEEQEKTIAELNGRLKEQQLQMMTDYMDREGIKVSKTRAKNASKYPSHDR